MNDHTVSATSETSKETVLDGGNKLQVKRRSKLPVQISKTSGIRQPPRSHYAAADQNLKNQVPVPAENGVHSERSRDKESNKHTTMACSQDTQCGPVISQKVITHVCTLLQCSPVDVVIYPKQIATVMKPSFWLTIYMYKQHIKNQPKSNI